MSLLGLRRCCEETGVRVELEREPAQRNHCHLASPRRRQRMFQGRSSDSAGSTLLTGLPRSSDPVSSSAFVPAYRCGAVPDSHRIPFYTLSFWLGDRGIDSLYMYLRTNAYKILWISRRCAPGRGRWIPDAIARQEAAARPNSTSSTFRTHRMSLGFEAGPGYPPIDGRLELPTDDKQNSRSYDNQAEWEPVYWSELGWVMCRASCRGGAWGDAA